MPQINESLMDMNIINSFIFLFSCDCLTVIADTDDDLLIFDNVTLLV